MILIIIGTRPQYIKIKPLCDYLDNIGAKYKLVDTSQHYSSNVSQVLIKELDLKINWYLPINKSGEIRFISESLIHLEEIIDKENPSNIIVIGDTNSTLTASITAKKKHIKLSHIEAGIRCGDKNRPEELNRILVDELADIHFISRENDKENVSNPIYVGDLEYCFLNSLKELNKNVSYDGDVLLTIHRQENLNVDRLIEIFNYCESLNYPIVFPIHHRTKNFILQNNKKNNVQINIPKNIKVVEPLTYFETVKSMMSCRGVISDSGGITKACPFFGKKCVIPLDRVEWKEVIDYNYAINFLDLNWFNDYIMKRNKDLYYVKNSCELIMNNL